MSTSAKLRDALGKRLLDILKADGELAPAMVAACVQFLKAFPPPDDAKDLPISRQISASLERYKSLMPFSVDVTE